MKEQLLRLSLCFMMCIFALNSSFGMSKIDTAPPVEVVNFTNDILIRDDAKEIVDNNEIPYQVIVDIYNRLINRDKNLMDFYNGDSMVFGSMYYMNNNTTRCLITVGVIKKTNVIKEVRVDYE
ncbi:exported hypothetical protein [Gammaproteobacteria bacterium]